MANGENFSDDTQWTVKRVVQRMFGHMYVKLDDIMPPQQVAFKDMVRQMPTSRNIEFRRFLSRISEIINRHAAEETTKNYILTVIIPFVIIPGLFFFAYASYHKLDFLNVPIATYEAILRSIRKL